MGVRYNPNPIEYYPSIPNKLVQQDYHKFKTSMPTYPNLNSPMKTVWENWKGYLIFLVISCIFWPIIPIALMALFLNAVPSSIINCYKAAKEQNELIKRYYDLIYQSKNYEEYSLVFDKELKRYIRKNPF